MPPTRGYAARLAGGEDGEAPKPKKVVYGNKKKKEEKKPKEEEKPPEPEPEVRLTDVSRRMPKTNMRHARAGRCLEPARYAHAHAPVL